MTRKAVRNNHACRLCRSRKVKCDSVHPTCGLCETENVQCTYEQDRRQLSRVSQAVIQRITDKLAEVEQTVNRLERCLSQQPLGQVQTPGATAPPINSPIRNAPVTPLPESQTTPVEIHTGVENDGGHISVYGPSSTFNPRLSYAIDEQPFPAAELPTAQEEDTAAERYRLFANSALQVQKEWTYMTERKFDLDGLDFDTAWHLLQIHWNHHHQAYLITYRPAIMHSLATNGPYINKLLLNAIYLSSALNSDRNDLHSDPTDRKSLGWRFLSRVQELALSELESSSVASAVGFLMAGSSLVSMGRQTAGWHYSGLGYRMIIDLGLHVDPRKLRLSHSSPLQPARRFTELELELHRRVYWGAYINDKFQALYFGRPPVLTAIGIEPSMEYRDNYEELELWKPYLHPRTNISLPPYDPQPAYTLSTCQSFIHLTAIMSDIVTSLYSPQVQFLSPEKTLKVVQDLHERLQAWKLNLPSHLQNEPSKGNVPPAHRFNPPMSFYMLHILLHRPFLPEGHLRHLHLSTPGPDTHREICLDAALQIYELAKLYRDTFTLRRATYMFSYCLFCAASIIPFGPGPGPMSASSNSVSLSQRQTIAWFWTALKELQNGANFGLRRPIMIIRSLIEHAGLDLNSILAHTQTHVTEPEMGSADASTNTNAGAEIIPGAGAGSDLLLPHVGESTHSHAAEADDADFERLCRDLFAGDVDGLAAPMATDLDESLLYGLFR